MEQQPIWIILGLHRLISEALVRVSLTVNVPPK